MRNFLLITISLLFAFSSQAQKSKKGFEYTGTKTRVSFVGKSKMFSEGVKEIPFTIFWNKKKETVTVNAGPKESWYVVQLNSTDTINGTELYRGVRVGSENETNPELIAKSKCEFKVQLDRISIKFGESRIEEYLIDGAKVWDDKPVSEIK